MTVSTCDCTEWPVPWPYLRLMSKRGTVTSLTSWTPSSAPVVSVHSASENVALVMILSIALSYTSWSKSLHEMPDSTRLTATMGVRVGLGVGIGVGAGLGG